jgi:Tol biopolymer transport system component
MPSTLWLVDVGERSVRSLMPDDGRDRDYYPTWLPDGRLVFAQLGTGLWVLDPASGETTRLIDFNDFPCDPACSNRLARLLVVSPDGKRLAFAAPGMGLRILDLGTGTTSESIRLPDGYSTDLRPSIRWTPDGTGLVMAIGEVTGEPFVATMVGRLDLATAQLTILARNVRVFDLRPR